MKYTTNQKPNQNNIVAGNVELRLVTAVVERIIPQQCICYNVLYSCISSYDI